MTTVAAEGDPSAVGILFSGQTHIPVKNLWLLMLYASDLFADDADIRQAGMEDSPDDLLDLVAEVLVDAAEDRLHRPLSRRHVTHRDDLTRVRGRIDHLRTEGHQLLARGRVACQYDDLSVDHLLNRVIVSALTVAERGCTAPALRERAAVTRRTFLWSGVSARPVSAAEAASLVLGRNDETERRCVSAARLLLQMAVFTEDSGTERAVTPRRDIGRWRKLYEAAIRGFFRAVLQEPWQPTMETDVVLRRPGLRIVVETKFTSPIGAHSQYGTRAFKRDHLFQLQTYLTTLNLVPGEALAGVLLYPQVDDRLDMTATVGQHTIRVKTVDLTGSASRIREDLMSVASS